MKPCVPELTLAEALAISLIARGMAHTVNRGRQTPVGPSPLPLPIKIIICFSRIAKRTDDSLSQRHHDGEESATVQGHFTSK